MFIPENDNNETTLKEISFTLNDHGATWILSDEDDEEDDCSEDYTDFTRMVCTLTDVHCKFTAENNFIEIHPDSMTSFGGVCIEFYDDGSFKGFIASE